MPWLIRIIFSLLDANYFPSILANVLPTPRWQIAAVFILYGHRNWGGRSGKWWARGPEVAITSASSPWLLQPTQLPTITHPLDIDFTWALMKFSLWICYFMTPRDGCAENGRRIRRRCDDGSQLYVGLVEAGFRKRKTNQLSQLRLTALVNLCIHKCMRSSSIL